MATELGSFGPARLLLSRLRGVRRVNKSWTSTCPSHEDRNPSLSIAESDDGRVLMHCFAGCPTTDVLAAVGLTLADLFPNPIGDPTTANRRALRQYAREANWSAALNVLGREATIVLIVANMLPLGMLSVDDAARLTTAVERIERAREVLK